MLLQIQFKLDAVAGFRHPVIEFIARCQWERQLLSFSFNRHITVGHLDERAVNVEVVVLTVDFLHFVVAVELEFDAIARFRCVIIDFMTGRERIRRLFAAKADCDVTVRQGDERAVQFIVIVVIDRTDWDIA